MTEEERKKLKFPPDAPKPPDLSELPDLPDPVKFAEQATGAIEKVTRGVETLDSAFTKLDVAFGLRSRSESDKIKSSDLVGKGELPCPVEDPEFASRIVRMAFEETKREIGGEHEMSRERAEEVKEKVKMRVMRKLGLER